jgi:hypothetical protein
VALVVSCQAVSLSQGEKDVYCNHQVHRDFLITMYKDIPDTPDPSTEYGVGFVIIAEYLNVQTMRWT